MNFCKFIIIRATEINFIGFLLARSCFLWHNNIMHTKEVSIKIKKIAEATSNFLYGNYYIAIVSLSVLFFWILKWQTAGFLTFVIIACYIFVSQRDMTPVLPLLLGIFFMPSDMSAFTEINVYLLFVPTAVCLIIHFVRFPIKKIRGGALTAPLVCVLVSFLIGGIFSNEIAGYFFGSVQILGIGVGMLFAYFVLNQYICPPNETDLKKYFFYTLLFVCLIPCVELYYVKSILGQIADYATMGWGDKNFVGYMILVAVPICYYFMANAKNIIPYFALLVFFCITAIFTECDGAIGILIIMLPFITFYTYRRINPNNRKLFEYLFFATILIVFCWILCIEITQRKFTEYVFNNLLNDTGRTGIYKIALQRFLLYPIFGNGVYYPVLPDAITPINYHSLILHVLATTGITGFVAYSFYIYRRFKTLTYRTDDFNVYAFFSVLFYELYCFVDCGEFLMTVIFVNVIVLITEYVNALPQDPPRIYLTEYKKQKISYKPRARVQ